MDEEQLCIKQFSVVKELGSGSFGQVKLVNMTSTDTLYALKTVKLNRLNQKEKDSALNEVRLLASISIPTVIKYEGSFFNLETNELCVLMEYADGGDLQVTSTLFSIKLWKERTPTLTMALRRSMSGRLPMSCCRESKTCIKITLSIGT